jgi:HSP20 family molecular chaperone IbpA
VIENDKEFILEFSIPGRDNLDFEIEIDNRLLSVSLKENDTIYGIGFESKDDLSGHLAKKTTGRLESTEE